MKSATRRDAALFNSPPTDVEHRSRRLYRSELPLWKCLGEINQFRSGSYTDTENPCIGRKFGKYHIDERMKCFAHRIQNSGAFVIGSSAFFVENNRWFLIFHGQPLLPSDSAPRTPTQRKPVGRMPPSAMSLRSKGSTFASRAWRNRKGP